LNRLLFCDQHMTYTPIIVTNGQML